MSLAFLSLVLLTTAPAAPASASPKVPEYARAFHSGDYSRAARLAADRLKVQPADIQARLVLARVEAATGRFDAAYLGFRKASRFAPHNPDALYYLGLTAAALAQAEYDRLLATAPESAPAHRVRARAHEAQGHTAEAIAEYEAALAAGPPSAEVLTALGDLRRSKSAFAEAAADYARAIELAPASYDALYGLGACRAYEGNHAEAVGLYRRALAVEPGSASARLALGISLLQTGQAEAAVSELREAVRLEPRMRQAHYQLGRAYQSLGRPEEAQAAFARARELLDKEHAAEAPGTGASQPPAPVP